MYKTWDECLQEPAAWAWTSMEKDQQGKVNEEQ